MKDYYAILGVDKSASQEDIKKAYRKLSMKYHPDKNLGDAASEEKFKEINEAYSIVGDEAKRAEYDNPNPFAHYANGADGFGDIFGGMDPFGFMRRHSARPDPNAPRNGKPIHIDVEIPLKTYIFGGNFNVKLKYQDSCQNCAGKGFTRANQCDLCKGSGMITMSEQHQGMIMTNSRPCPKCVGRGVIPTETCVVCNNGLIEASKEFNFDVPKDVRLGMAYTISGEGRKGINGGRSGDVTMLIASVKKLDTSKLSPEKIELLKSILEEAGDDIKST